MVWPPSFNLREGLGDDLSERIFSAANFEVEMGASRFARTANCTNYIPLVNIVPNRNIYAT